jgi:hypothetical protein
MTWPLRSRGGDIVGEIGLDKPVYALRAQAVYGYPISNDINRLRARDDKRSVDIQVVPLSSPLTLEHRVLALMTKIDED